MLHVLEMVLQKILHKPDSFPQILRYQQEVLLSLSHLPSSYHSLLKLPAHFSGTDVSGLQCRYLQTLLYGPIAAGACSVLISLFAILFSP